MNFTFTGTSISSTYADLESTIERALASQYNCSAAVSINDPVNAGNYSDDFIVNIDLEEESPQLTGSQLIEQERRRQITEEGWTAEHDRQHLYGELCKAALGYTFMAARQIKGIDELEHAEMLTYPPPSNCWPWSSKWWKPSRDPIRNLVKAAALIAAEIDRLKQQNEAHNT